MALDDEDFRDFAIANEDDPYRTCAQCDARHHEEYGRTCASCDEWICQNCWDGAGDVRHADTDEHGRREGGG